METIKIYNKQQLLWIKKIQLKIAIAINRIRARSRTEVITFTRFQLWHGQRTTLGPSLRATLPVQAFGGIAGGARD